MTQIDPNRWPEGDFRTLWTEEMDRPITHLDIRALELELGLMMHGIYRDEEYTVGVKAINPTHEEGVALMESGNKTHTGSTLLVARRRSEMIYGVGPKILPGLKLMLHTTVETDTAEQYEDLRADCVRVLATLGVDAPQPGHGLFLVGESISK